MYTWRNRNVRNQWGSELNVCMFICCFIKIVATQLIQCGFYMFECVYSCHECHFSLAVLSLCCSEVCLVSRGSSTVSRGSWGGKKGRAEHLQEVLSRQLCTGSHCPPLPSMHFSSHAHFFLLFSFSLPSKLPCGACWHGISQPRTQSPLVLSVLKVGARPCLCVRQRFVCVRVPCVQTCQCWGSFSPFSATRSHHTICHSPPIDGREKRERSLFFFFFPGKSILASWQHPNYKIVETSLQRKGSS